MQGQQDLIETPGVDAVRDELDRLLASPLFQSQQPFPNFLRFVVEHALAGDIDNIKERTLGIEIFGRDADYDTVLGSHRPGHRRRDSQTGRPVLSGSGAPP